jgi:glycerate kinase
MMRKQQGVPETPKGPEAPLRVLIAVDSFKGSVTSAQAGELIARGVRRACPRAQTQVVPIADGGEGTLDALLAQGGSRRRVQVEGPLGVPVEACYGVLDDGSAVVEMASAAGIGLSSCSEADALRASTFGVGELLRDALDQNAHRIYLGLGGSATSDGGAGALCALGARLLDQAGGPVGRGLAGLRDVARVDLSSLDDRLRQTEIVLLTDVSNPLTGPSGAVRVYGPQKGVPRGRLSEADVWMARYAQAVCLASKTDYVDHPGAGAAGGLGFGLMACAGAHCERGIEAVLDAVGFDRLLAGTDFVITGEGRMDAQTAQGKAPVGVARRARAKGIAVAAVVGSRADDVGGVWGQGIGLIIPAVTEPMSLSEAFARTRSTLPIAGESAMRAFLLGR